MVERNFSRFFSTFRYVSVHISDQLSVNNIAYQSLCSVTPLSNIVVANAVQLYRSCLINSCA